MRLGQQKLGLKCRMLGTAEASPGTGALQGVPQLSYLTSVYAW